MLSSVHPPSRAMTLIEVLVSLVIVSVMLVAALQTVGATAGGRQIRAQRSLGVRLAEQLAGEILVAHFDEPDGGSTTLGRDGGEVDDDRIAWDDVDDYDGWKSVPPRLKDGTTVDGAVGWERSVVVKYVDPADPDVPVAGPTTLKRVVVTAKAPSGVSTSIATLCARDGLATHEPVLTNDYLDAVHLTIEAGSVATVRVDGSTPVLNPIKVISP